MNRKLLVLIPLLALIGCTAPQSAEGWLYVVAPGELRQVWFPTGNPDRVVGKTQDALGNGILLLDIALNPKDGQLYGVNDTLYRVDKNTATLTPVGSGLEVFPVATGISNEAVALVFSKDGMLYAGVGGDTLAKVDTITGKGTAIGRLGNSYTYNGDMAFAPDGRLFASASGAEVNDDLLSVSLQTGAGTRVGNIGYRKVYGLQFIGETLYGLTEGNPSVLIRIDTATGQGTFVRNLSVPVWGVQSQR